MLRSETDFPSTEKIDRKECPEAPLCPACHAVMRLAWIEPGKRPGFDRRTFECTHCHNLDVLSVKYF